MQKETTDGLFQFLSDAYLPQKRAIKGVCLTRDLSPFAERPNSRRDRIQKRVSGPRGGSPCTGTPSSDAVTNLTYRQLRFRLMWTQEELQHVLKTLEQVRFDPNSLDLLDFLAPNFHHCLVNELEQVHAEDSNPLLHLPILSMDAPLQFGRRVRRASDLSEDTVTLTPRLKGLSMDE
jgi:hypothetical protein